ncbi:hypothetical protein [Tautonia sociabilis]|uniref:Uncharacterized protein n=1 Tax=Tautonia sociabilis TaxID=2080755 RepID=A0A432MQA8_9BACT|nr:hypothetical protein [Tautonia sociabilis]RUL89664.1 hypothetical protein TsocGM_00385 [Tautonia sociabilis]
MARPRYSLRRLLAAVAAAGVACAYLAAAARLEARVVSGMTLAILAVAAVAPIATRGRARALASGFAVPAWAYFIASNAGRPSGLVTTRWLAAAYDRLIGPPVALTPDQVAGFTRQVVSFLVVGHHLVALLLGTLGALIVLAARAVAGHPRSDRARAATSASP